MTPEKSFASPVIEGLARSERPAGGQLARGVLNNEIRAKGRIYKLFER
jgi:hypothetical protein